MKTRILTLGALAILTANVANAGVVFDTVTGIGPGVGSDGPAADGATIIAQSFTASPSNFTISLNLSATTPHDGGSIMVFLSPDTGTNSGPGGCGTPGPGVCGLPSFVGPAPGYNFTSLAGSQAIGTILDSSLTVAPSLVTLKATPPIATANNEYWVTLEFSSGASSGWAFETTSAGVGTTGQGFLNNAGGSPDLQPLSNAGPPFAAYQMTVTTPEPATITVLGLGLVGLGYVRRRKAAKQA